MPQAALLAPVTPVVPSAPPELRPQAPPRILSEDDLDQRENQARTAQDVGRIDAEFWAVMVVGTATLTAVVAAIIRWCWAP